MNILITGGLGFIGSHTVVELIEKGHNCIIVDNLINSKIDVLDSIEKITNIRPKFYQFNLLVMSDLRKVFEENEIDGVIHFAALKSVNESISKSLEYYENNIVGSINLLKCMQEYNVTNFVFSSSACVYGIPEKNPVTEDSPSDRAINPYGKSKVMVETILQDLFVSDPSLQITILRYFNPIGAHKSGLIGEDPNGIPNNLMPYILKVASGESETLNIYGKDYDTKDGTCIRDFIHVVDLAKGHVKAIENMKNGVNIYNLGTGKGTTVLELVNSFNKVNGNMVKYEFVDRRAGDVPINWASVDKAKKELDWEAAESIDSMCQDSWNYRKNRETRCNNEKDNTSN